MGDVHRYEGTVNRMMGDGIMALFGALMAREDHAIPACCMAVRRYAEELPAIADVRRRPVSSPRT